MNPQRRLLHHDEAGAIRCSARRSAAIRAMKSPLAGRAGGTCVDFRAPCVAPIGQQANSPHGDLPNVFDRANKHAGRGKPPLQNLGPTTSGPRLAGQAIEQRSPRVDYWPAVFERLIVSKRKLATPHRSPPMWDVCAKASRQRYLGTVKRFRGAQEKAPASPAARCARRSEIDLAGASARAVALRWGGRSSGCRNCAREGNSEQRHENELLEHLNTP